MIVTYKIPDHRFLLCDCGWTSDELGDRASGFTLDQIEQLHDKLCPIPGLITLKYTQFCTGLGAKRHRVWLIGYAGRWKVLYHLPDGDL